MTEVWTEVLDTSFNFLGIDIYQILKDGVFSSYVAKAQKGYVFCDTTANDTEFDPNTEEQLSVTYYYTICEFSCNYNMDKFSLVAVPRDSVDEKYIF